MGGRIKIKDQEVLPKHTPLFLFFLMFGVLLLTPLAFADCKIVASGDCYEYEPDSLFQDDPENENTLQQTDSLISKSDKKGAQTPLEYILSILLISIVTLIWIASIHYLWKYVI